LGFALQLGAVRFLGAFLSDPSDIPAGVIQHVAQQLNLPATTDLARYRESATHWVHASEIKQR
jgi:hypothetical protein